MAAVLRFAQRLMRRAPSPPRQHLSRAEPQFLDSSMKYEEETLEWYTRDKFYPVQLWETLSQRYQVIGKLGYGGSSTVWLGRDLIRHNYVSIKICECNSFQAARELKIYKQLSSIKSRHAGTRCVRTLLDSFEIKTAAGSHICLVHKPLGLRLSEFQALCPGGKLLQDILKLTLIHILFALDYLHAECRLVHTDIQAQNILLNIDDEKILAEFDNDEISNPSPCKVDGDHIIYTSRSLRLRGSAGRPVLCDFGEARIGDGVFTDDIQPYLYRAPEVILQIPWSKEVDIWNLGVVAWDLAQNKHIFNARNASNESSTAQHLAEMIALLGPPPKSFLQRGKATTKFFDINGNLSGGIEIPPISLEQLEENLDGVDKTLFLQFMRKMLQWVPEERKPAIELLEDPWLNSR